MGNSTVRNQVRFCGALVPELHRLMMPRCSLVATLVNCFVQPVMPSIDVFSLWDVLTLKKYQSVLVRVHIPKEQFELFLRWFSCPTMFKMSWSVVKSLQKGQFEFYQVAFVFDHAPN